MHSTVLWVAVFLLVQCNGETDELTISTSMAQCRAHCITKIAPSSSPGRQSCKASPQCTQCWSTCGQLAEHYPIYSFRCRQKTTCTLGCSNACDFFAKANATPPPLSPQHPSVYIPPTPPTHPTPPARLSLEFDGEGARWTLHWVDQNKGHIAAPTTLTPGTGSHEVSECDTCGACGVVFSLFTKNKHHLPWVLYKQTQANQITMEGVQVNTSLQLVAVANCGIVSVIITPYSPPRENHRRNTLPKEGKHHFEKRYETLAQHYAQKAAKRREQQALGIWVDDEEEDTWQQEENPITTAVEETAKSSWDLHYNVTVNMTDLIYTQIWWDHAKANDSTGGFDYLVTWEDQSGTLKGHSMTKNNFISFDLWPHTIYKIKAEIVMGPFVEPMKSNVLFLDAASLYDQMSYNLQKKEVKKTSTETEIRITTSTTTTEKPKTFQDLLSSDNYVYANVDSDYVPQSVQTVVAVDTNPVLTPIPYYYPIESQETKDVIQTEKMASDKVEVTKKSNNTVQTSDDSKEVVRKEMLERNSGEYLQRIPVTKQSIHSSEEIYNTEPIVLYNSDMHFRPEGYNEIKEEGISKEVLAGIITSFVLFFLLIVIALIFMRYRCTITKKTKGNFTASSSISSKTTTTDSACINHQWLSSHQPTQIELLDKNNPKESATSGSESSSIRYTGMPVKTDAISSLSQSCDSLLVPMINQNNYPVPSNASNASSSTNTSYLSNGSSNVNSQLHFHHAKQGLPVYHNYQINQIPNYQQSQHVGGEYQMQEDYAEIIEPNVHFTPNRDICCQPRLPAVGPRSSLRSCPSVMPNQSQYVGQYGTHLNNAVDHNRSHSHNAMMYQPPTPDILPNNAQFMSPHPPAPLHTPPVTHFSRSKPIVPQKPTFAVGGGYRA